MAVHALAQTVLAVPGDEAWLIILRDEIVQVVVGLENDAAAAPAVAAARPALGHERLAMERDAAFAAVPRMRVIFYLVNEHEIILQPISGLEAANPAKSKNSLLFPSDPAKLLRWESSCRF